MGTLPPIALVLLLTLTASNHAKAGWEPAGELDGAEVVLDILEASDRTLYAGTYPDGKVFVSLDEGITWEEAAPLPGAIIAYSIVERPDSAVVVGTFPAADLFVTTDRGLSWIQFPGPPEAEATEIYSLLVASNGQILAGCAPTGTIFRSPDGGESWIPSGELSEAIVPWCIEEGPEGTLWAGTTWGTGIFRMTNWDGSWEQVGTFRDGTDVLESPTIAAILPETVDGGLYAGMVHRGHESIGGLFRSTDGGQEWLRLRGFPFCGGVWALLETSSMGIWAGLGTLEENLVYRTFDAGRTWWPTGPLAGAREVFTLVETSSGWIVAGTAPNGEIFRFNLAASADPDGLAGQESLRLTIHPNPAPGPTAFSFRIPGEGTVSLSIYDLTGRRVRTLLSRPLAAGTHRLDWDTRVGDGDRLAAGIYFPVLRSGGETVTGKLVLVAP